MVVPSCLSCCTCCPVLPSSYMITASGFSGDASVFNGSFTLPWIVRGNQNPCQYYLTQWMADGSAGVQVVGNLTFGLITKLCGEYQASLQLGYGGGQVGTMFYQSTGNSIAAWNCLGANSLSFQSLSWPGTQTHPATISVAPGGAIFPNDTSQFLCGYCRCPGVNPGGFPIKWKFNIPGTGITNNAGWCLSCSSFNGNQEDDVFSAVPCSDAFESSFPCSSGANFFKSHLFYHSPSDEYFLKFGDGGWFNSPSQMWTYYSVAAGSWNCSGPNTLSLAHANTNCRGWPPTITLTPG